ncbi:hypothetical protein PROFUN_00533 [Planoprotostelium fungivorum]|uniref:Ubiquitinyl hydrolase 1 n=1 Tax=Planoprotostelium fungivorum TaxID=1890364 RepID=A0A2P6N130_9EUKA|nr:hypothetical protein PROFUN_00533 [Planoprotostelium fungivorum]
MPKIFSRLREERQGDADVQTAFSSLSEIIEDDNGQQSETSPLKKSESSDHLNSNETAKSAPNTPTKGEIKNGRPVRSCKRVRTNGYSENVNKMKTDKSEKTDKPDKTPRTTQSKESKQVEKRDKKEEKKASSETPTERRETENKQSEKKETDKTEVEEKETVKKEQEKKDKKGADKREVEKRETDKKEKKEQKDMTPSHNLKVGTTLWAKIPTWPWWPGIIVDPKSSEVPSGLSNRKRNSNCQLVRFFATEDFCWVDPKNISFPLTNQFLQRYDVTEPLLEYAIELAAEESPQDVKDKVELMIEETHCTKCESAEDDSQMLLCDRCNRGYHLYCLDPPLSAIPEEDWFCPKCSRVTRATNTAIMSRGSAVVLGPGLVGLHNIDSSCYINSTLQCLSSYTLFGQKLIDTPHQGDQFITVMQSILSSIYRGRSIEPQMLLRWKEASGTALDLKYHENEHQDVNEFLMFTLDHLSEHCKETDEGVNESVMIEDMFDGSYDRVRTCPEGHVSTRAEMFRVMTLPFPQEKKTMTIPLRDMFDVMRQEEVIECRCETCGGKDNSRFKQTTCITKWPKDLILQMGRFSSMVNEKRWWSNKINTEVEFPLEEFSLGGNSPIYNLRAVANHRGGANGGHYWAVINVEGKWYSTDDQNVNLIEPEDVQSPYAYMLFYQQKHIPTTLPTPPPLPTPPLPTPPSLTPSSTSTISRVQPDTEVVKKSQKIPKKVAESDVTTAKKAIRSDNGRFTSTKNADTLPRKKKPNVAPPSSTPSPATPSSSAPDKKNPLNTDISCDASITPPSPMSRPLLNLPSMDMTPSIIGDSSNMMQPVMSMGGNPMMSMMHPMMNVNPLGYPIMWHPLSFPPSTSWIAPESHVGGIPSPIRSDDEEGEPWKKDR